MKQNNIIPKGKNALEQWPCSAFLTYMSQDVALDEETIALVSANCQEVKLAKGKRLLTAGNVCEFVYFIVSGECISYFSDFKGKATTWFFHFNIPGSKVKNLFAVDYKSFLLKEPATLSIETLSPVTAIRFSYDDIRYLIEKSRTFERWKRMHNEKTFIQTFDRISTLLTLDAGERYEKFLKDESCLLNMFSHYLIATYLDVAPQSLSRIRKNCQEIKKSDVKNK